MQSAVTFPLYLIPLLPLLGAATNLLIGRRLGRNAVSLVACGSVGVSAVLSLHAVFGPLWSLWEPWHRAHGVGVAEPAIRDALYTWMQSGALKIELAFLLDPLSAVMICTVTFVGFLIHVYSMGYMAHDRRYATYFGYLNLFTGAMLILVLGDSLPVMFIGWEGVGLCSYLLIGFWFDKEKNANAGRKAFVVNRIGDFGFLLGIFLIYLTTRSLDYAGIKSSIGFLLEPGWQGGPSRAFLAALLLFVGACGKSAQIPLYVWLPDAMAGPTPVSALIHAATMVTAGVYMVARMGFLFVAAPGAMMVVAGVGAATALFAALIGFAQTDIKKVLAYSTVSQLGFMFVAVGVGAFAAGIFHLFTHAFFKAGLFLGAGSVMHAMGDRTEIMEMGGLRRKLRWTHGTFLVYCLAITGVVPFMSGFVSKDEILLGAFTAHLHTWPAWYGKTLWAVLMLAALGTAFYMWRLYFLVFAGESRADEETKAHIHESPSVMTVPLAVLAAGAIGLGLLGLPHVFHGVLPTDLFAEWLRPSLAGAAHHAGGGTTLGLMGGALAVGLVGFGVAALFYWHGPGERIRRVVAAIPRLRKWAVNKFYVDELYDLFPVRAFRWLATGTYNLVDRFVIDLLLVNGAAFVVDVAGRISRWWQNGDVQRYLAAVVVGAAGLLWITTLGTPEFAVSGTGTTRSFVADVGGGPEAQGSLVSWDFDGDGKEDARTKEATWDFRKPGQHRVVMTVKDAIRGIERRVARTITIPGAAPAAPAPRGAGGGGER